MIERRKNLPEVADVSAVTSNNEKGALEEQAHRIFVSLTDIAVCMRMRQLALRGTRWHETCIVGRSGGSA